MNFDHVLVCEIQHKKRQHLIDHFSVQHAFGDVTHMGRRSSWCYVEKKSVTIPGELDILFAGFVCKSFSALNQTAAQNAILGTSSSATTFKGVRDYARAHKPKVIVLENVKGLLSMDPKQTCSRADVIVRIFRDIGYHGRYITVNSKDYLLPQNRPRVYFVFHKVAEDSERLDTTQLLAALRTSSYFSLTSILKAGDEARASSDRPGKEWISKHNAYAKQNLLEHLATPEAREKELRGSFVDALGISARAKSSLLIHWQLAQKRGERPEATEFIWDLSQEVVASRHTGDCKSNFAYSLLDSLRISLLACKT